MPAVTLCREYLPATGESRVELVLLHGWGSNREIWRAMLPVLRPWANVTLLDLPGLAPGLGPADVELDDLLAAIEASVPRGAVYLGWSLGGQLAMAMAERNPAGVAAVATLCSTPRFSRVDQWPGMAPEILDQFAAAVKEDPRAGLRRFDSLQTAGVENRRALLRHLQEIRGGREGGAINSGLNWLAQLDQRSSWAAKTLPQLHLLGESDGLLSEKLEQGLRNLLAANGKASVAVLPGASHLAVLEQGEQIGCHLFSFLDTEGLLELPASKPAPLAKADVALSFSRAAPLYDSVASLQRDVGTALLQCLDGLAEAPHTLLDLGSGTGYFCPELKARFPDTCYLGLDLAEGMARYAREHHPQGEHWLVGDAEALPLASNSVDLIFSSLALQWCHRTKLLFAELVRVLRPGGRCVFTTLGPDTLKELRASWAAVDEHQHVNSFLPANALLQDASGQGDLQLREETYRMEYTKVGELLHELKTLGAHNVNRDRPSGLTGRRALQGMMRAYEDWREEGVLPATYQVYFVTLEKP